MCCWTSMCHQNHQVFLLCGTWPFWYHVYKMSHQSIWRFGTEYVFATNWTINFVLNATKLWTSLISVLRSIVSTTFQLLDVIMKSRRELCSDLKQVVSLFKFEGHGYQLHSFRHRKSRLHNAYMIRSPMIKLWMFTAVVLSIVYNNLHHRGFDGWCYCDF